ncbi:hypothetical protein PINS_up000586 [Pythium insidiosum]|nr:hypothetical protein PINS_up000586 [Pythium insidiosum]
MDALAKVLAAKKRELSAIKAEKERKNEKYLRRADVEGILYQQQQQQQQQEEEEKAKARKQASRRSDSDDGAERSASKKRKLETRERNATDSGASGDEARSQTDTTRVDDADSEVTLAWPEMKRRLRDLGHPVTLFGETMRQRMQRLRRAEHDAASRREEELGEGHDIRNQFVGHQRDDDEHEGPSRDDVEDEATVPPEGRAGDSAAGLAAREDGTDDPHAVDEKELEDDVLVYRFFKSMLLRWEQDLADRPDHVKRTAQGKLATKTMKQCKDYIRPLFKLCKRRQVPADILPNLVEIVRFCRMGEFVRANDAYIRLAIGNAAWPIGVTMVGIHERTGREKINANKQAHVMNNEAQRKYITSVKRLISYAQSIASVLPSKKVA